MQDKHIDASQIPMLSRHAAELLRLSEESRDNIRLLGLLALQDPVATARILALANAAAQATGRVVSDIEAALARVGSTTAYSILVKSALLNSLVSRSHPKELEYLARHIFSAGLTARRVATSLPREMDVNFGTLTLQGAIEKLGLAWMVRVAEDAPEAMQAFAQLQAARRHCFREDPALMAWLARSALVAEAWELGGALPQDIRLAAPPDADVTVLSAESCCLLLAAQYLELADSGLGDTSRMEALETRLGLAPNAPARARMTWFA